MFEIAKKWEVGKGTAFGFLCTWARQLVQCYGNEHMRWGGIEETGLRMAETVHKDPTVLVRAEGEIYQRFHSRSKLRIGKCLD